MNNKIIFIFFKKIIGWFLCLSLLVLSACSHLNSTLEKAQQAGFHKTVWHTKQFPVVTWVKIHNNKLLTIYIEGDGHAWKNRYRISLDPTPKNPVSLKLAIQDKGGAVLYLSRPCQYLTSQQRQTCPPKYWTSHRASKTVIESLNQVIEQVIKKYQITQIALIGYSGGGGIAPLIAAKRKDVAWIITLAGNLDHQSWTKYHKVTALTGSLNALDIATQINHIPQHHFLGKKDKIIPPLVINRYLEKAGHPEWLTLIKDYNHSCCWEKNWPALLCENKKQPWFDYFCMD